MGIDRIRRATVFLIGVAAMITGCGSANAPLQILTEPAPGGWERVGDAPLSGRMDAGAYWTGHEVLVVGGSASTPCPPGADCEGGEELSDGAAFDPSTGTWRPIADAPVTLTWHDGVLVEGDLYVMGTDYGDEQAGDYFVRYDVDADRWTELPTPPRAGERSLVAFDGQIVAYLFSHERDSDGPDGARPGGPRDIPDTIWDPATETWSDLPRDPIAPSFDRSMEVDADGALHLYGIDLVPNPGSDEHPTNQRAAIYRDGAWTEVGVEDDAEVACRDAHESAPTTSTTIEGIGPFATYWCYDDPTTGQLAPVPEPPLQPPGVSLLYGEQDGRFFNQDLVFDTRRPGWQSLGVPDELDREGVASVWAGDRLFVFGGATLADGDGFDAYTNATLEHDAWTWRPATS